MPAAPMAVRSIVIAIENGRVLLVTAKVSPDTWVPPGGKLDRGETVPEAAAREAREESGVEVVAHRLIAYREVWRDQGDALELFFAGRLAPGASPATGERPEGRRVRWVDVAQLPTVQHMPRELPMLCDLADGPECGAQHLRAIDLRSDSP